MPKPNGTVQMIVQAFSEPSVSGTQLGSEGNILPGALMVALKGIIPLLDQDNSRPFLQDAILLRAGFSWDWMLLLGIMATRPSELECGGEELSTADLLVASGS